ncbi:MAG: DUF695 domain-containing protein [Chloroflexi bacterium]|nr:DUF695 domain-containing protein [Chloroflexota bacterium]
MAWQLAPGRMSQHAFCLSPEGSPELRQVALRWLDAAPPSDAVWEYYASKQASPDLQTLEMDGGVRFDLDETRAISSWDPSRMRLDVRLWHPGFERIPEPIRLEVAYIFLDNLLGQDDVERWIGSIDVLDARTGGRTPAELKAEVERRRMAVRGDETWVMNRIEHADGRLTMIIADASLKRIDHPYADHHVGIGVVLEAGGMPDDALAAALNAEEDDLLARLTGVAIHAARTTTPGLRTLHFVTEDTERMKSAIDAWARGLPRRGINVELERDMGWDFQVLLGIR